MNFMSESLKIRRHCLTYPTDLSKHYPLSTIQVNAAFQNKTQTILSISAAPKRDAHRVYAPHIRASSSFRPLIPRRNMSHKDLETKQTTFLPPADKWRACTCYAHLVTRLGKLGAVRLVPLSPLSPSPLLLLSLPLLPPLSNCSSYPARHVWWNHRKQEQCRGIAILCK